MKNGRTVIRASQSGWVVVHNNDVANFVTFLSTEPERFVKYICENVAGIKVDQLLSTRQADIARAAKQFEDPK